MAALLRILTALTLVIAVIGGGEVFGKAVLLSETRIATLRARIAAQTEPTSNAWQQVLKDATKALAAEPHAPKAWYVPGFYRDAQGHRSAKQALQDDANAAYALALAFRMTGDARFAASPVRIIDAWATRVETLSKKDDSTLSFSYHFPPLILAADLLRACPAFPADAQARFRGFVREKALPQNTMARDNNWGNWGLMLVLASASYLEDRVLFDQGLARWKVFIEKQIAEDGHLPHEVDRNGGRSGLWYSNFSLLPQTLAAEIARVNGVDLYDHRASNGRTLRQAFDRLAAWTLEPKTFPYFKGDPKDLHGYDYVSYYEILDLHWPDPAATQLLTAKRPLSAEHGAPYLTFTHGGLLRDDGR